VIPTRTVGKKGRGKEEKREGRWDVRRVEKDREHCKNPKS
jgi:hypothetical protein